MSRANFRSFLMTMPLLGGALVAGGHALAAPGENWLNYGNDAGAMRYSPLTQITPANVSKLKETWSYRPAGPAPAADAAKGKAKAKAKARKDNDTAEALQLYNLRQDPGETQNMATSQPAKVQELQQLLDQWLQNAVPSGVPAE